MDGLDERYIRRAFLKREQGASVSQATVAACVAQGYKLAEDDVWVRLDVVAPCTELCPLCLLAFVSLRPVVDAVGRTTLVGRHDACGTVLFAEV
ncbi:MAG: hypothetical protein EB084_12180 [Proteobacteria bacterium]|nr:hypothetical protein [Pseudomonadota bacterium]